MKRMLVILLTLIAPNLFGQDNLTELARPVVEEGKRLYRSEMASWYGTDIFLEKYKNRENIGGYFSYSENDMVKCIFFSNTEKPKVIGTISFDSTYNTKTAKADLREREFTPNETDIYAIRSIALAEITSDTLFKTFKGSNLNLIPLINGGHKKVYVLTGPDKSGVVIFGNDYLLTFDNNNKLTGKRRLHSNIIPVTYGDKMVDGKQVAGTIHSHNPETGDLITATDICTLMLYEKYTGWKQHNVVSEKYLSIWNCLTNELRVTPMENKAGK